MFLSGVGHFFEAAYDSTVSEVSSIASGAEDMFEGALGLGEDTVSTVYNDGRSVVKWAGDRVVPAQDLVDHTVGSTVQIVDHAEEHLGHWGEKIIDDTASTISTPMMLLAGGLGIAAVMMGRNSSLTVR